MIIVCIFVGKIEFCVVLILFVFVISRISVVVESMMILIMVDMFRVIVLLLIRNVGCMLLKELKNIIKVVVKMKINIDIIVLCLLCIFLIFIFFELKYFLVNCFWYFGLFISFLFIFIEKSVFISMLIMVVGIVILRILNRVMLKLVNSLSKVIVVVEMGFVVMVCCEVMMVMLRGCFG